MKKDPTEFRKRFAAWKNGKLPYKDGLPAYEGGKEDEFDAFLKTLPDNQSAPGAYNTRRYWELNGKPKNFAEAIGIGMYNVQKDNGILGWHANSVSYNDKNDTYEFMKPNYHPTRWMELVLGYDKDKAFQKDWKVQYNGPMLSDRYVRREKPGFKIKGGLLPKFADGKESVRVGDYNIYPSAIGASELNVTTPEIVVTGKDRRPLYLRYAAEQSTFDPNTIRNFTDWLPVVGDIGTGIDIKNAIQNNNYLEASALGAGFILPPAAARILRNPIQKTIKYGKRFFNTPAYTYATRSGLSNGEVEFSEKYASRFADQTVTPTGPEKAMFSLMYSKGISRNLFMSKYLMNYSILHYTNAGFTREQASRIQQMFLRNPEYAKYIETKGGLRNINPLSQSTVDDFLKLQFTSLRGVHAPDKESAMIYLTHGEKGRNMPGGDRLGTNGGVYTSNSTNVADRFKNPEFGTEDGWVGRVVYPYDIRRDIPIEDQLELYRKMVFPAGEIHPMYGTESYFRELQNARNGLSIAIESDYVGRASRGVPGQERAYLPIKKESHPILNVESVSYYPNQTNQNGRWGYGIDAGDTDGLFIPRQMNAYSDFIRSAKTFLSPRIKRDRIVYSDRYKQASDLWKAQARKRDSIVRKIENTNDKIKKAAGLTMLFSPVVAAGLGIYKKIKSDEEFYNSPEYELLLSDPNYEKYLNIDDGSFWKLGSFERLEHKYKRKYLNRIGDK